MMRIMIIGPGGAGKSTLSRKLGGLLGLPVYHLDALQWKPNWTPTQKSEWEGIIEGLIAKEEWILDGNYTGTMAQRIGRADTIIFMDYSRLKCIYRISKRRFTYRNKTRPDVAEGCKERLDLQFLRWVWTYPSRIRPRVEQMLEKASPDKIIIRIRNDKDAESLLKRIEERE